MNNILSGILSYPELLLMDIPEDSPLRDGLLTIKQSGEKAAAVVEDLLTLARRGVTTSEVVNLNDIVTDYLDSPEFKKLISAHPRVETETNLEADLNTLGSTVHLSKTLMNLVSNAVEAMPAGGILGITTANQYVDRPISGYDNVAEGDYLVLTVADTGTGIPPEAIDRVFEPFYTKKQMGRTSGTGLGMAVVWGTVKDHRGYIDLRSSVGKGTTFTLYFPVTRREATEEEAVSMEDIKGNGETVLVIDDIREQRELASGILTKLEYAVVTVGSGEEAVAHLQDKTADLLVLDMIMEGMDGLETYKQILEIHPQQKAIIASGYSETDRVRTAQNLGAGAYVKKPYTMQNIGLAVRQELNKDPSP